MPNWCEGVLKVRGTKEKILEFLKNGIAYCDYVPVLKDGEFFEKKVPKDCPFKSDEWGFTIKNVDSLWVEGTRRMFINADTIEGDWDDKEKEIICIDIRQAWGINAENLKTLSEKYGLDFRVFATERGMEFCQLVEVIDGKITRDDEITFDDFKWEAPDNRLGG